MNDRDRRAELIAAAVDGGLTAAERAELDVLRTADATIGREIDELRALIGRMSATLPDWDRAEPSAALRERILRSDPGAQGRLQADGETGPLADPADSADEGARILASRRRPWLLPVAAAACLLIGAGGTLAVQSVGNSPPTGPPGTLGAVEQVDFTGEDTGVSVDGALVAHTWGTETVLEIDGLPVGDTYSVVVIAQDGTGFDAGTFLGSDVPIDCRMNAAVLRTEVASVQIEDDAGTVVAAAEVPAAS